MSPEATTAPSSSAPQGGGHERSSEGPRGPRPARRDFGGGGGGGGGGKDRFVRRRVCQFCVDKVVAIDYKDVARLRRYLSDRGKIEPRRKTGNCAKHQRTLTVALKRARQIALLPYTAEHLRFMQR